MKKKRQTELEKENVRMIASDRKKSETWKIGKKVRVHNNERQEEIVERIVEKEKQRETNTKWM